MVPILFISHSKFLGCDTNSNSEWPGAQLGVLGEARVWSTQSCKIGEVQGKLQILHAWLQSSSRVG
jgi:hypothetical protein